MKLLEHDLLRGREPRWRRREGATEVVRVAKHAGVRQMWWSLAAASPRTELLKELLLADMVVVSASVCAVEKVQWLSLLVNVRVAHCGSRD